MEDDEMNKSSNASEIVEVYLHNFNQELDRISTLAQEYNYIAMVRHTIEYVYNKFHRILNFQGMFTMVILKYIFYNNYNI